MPSSDFLDVLRAPYPDQRDGFWGPQTSTLNFCEEDYVLSYYCAELCNTLTNALFIWLGIRGIRSCVQHSHPFVFILAYVGYIIVGLGSILFHASLKYPMQLIDELSMIYTTCLMMHASFSSSRSRWASAVLGASLLGLATFITMYYHITKDPAFHQGAYAALTASIVFRSMWVMEAKLRPALKANRVASQQLLRTMWAMVITGLAIFLGGYLLWSLDNEFCSQIRRWRRAIGLPWAIVLEGHAWWHLMTGLGAYYYITWGIWLRHCLSGRAEKYYLHWPSITSIPEVKRIDNDMRVKKL